MGYASAGHRELPDTHSAKQIRNAIERSEQTTSISSHSEYYNSIEVELQGCFLKRQVLQELYWAVCKMEIFNKDDQLPMSEEKRETLFCLCSDST